jgi:hypothetical protein
MQQMRENLTRANFAKVLDDIENFVFEGKGNERHGHSWPFEEQPWVPITAYLGTGFVAGQVLKKLIEASRRPATAESTDRELLGAAGYLIQMIMWGRSNREIIPEGER